MVILLGGLALSVALDFAVCVISGVTRNAIPVAEIKNASASRVASPDVPGQPAELSSISGQDRHGWRNTTKPPIMPVRVNRIPVTAERRSLAVVMLYRTTSAGGSAGGSAGSLLGPLGA
ncbi:hypothetical protein I2487_01175 [Nesterenkonia sp. E16_10]|uniref:hypothetical protein n=1 Tax=unclassified Nesterenkonia TaxID=2629769 RepID=UPI001A91263D|nr:MULTISPECIES: hypothetical protein [unclassified Nesterenkonia]MBO0594264.1 hypothetical protein [Nesterenkonia sp. E16_10]